MLRALGATVTSSVNSLNHQAHDRLQSVDNAPDNNTQ